MFATVQQNAKNTKDLVIQGIADIREQQQTSHLRFEGSTPSPRTKLKIKELESRKRQNQNDFKNRPAAGCEWSHTSRIPGVDGGSCHTFSNGNADTLPNQPRQTSAQAGQEQSVQASACLLSNDPQTPCPRPPLRLRFPHSMNSTSKAQTLAPKPQRFWGGRTSPGPRQKAYLQQGRVTLEEMRAQQKTAPEFRDRNS